MAEPNVVRSIWAHWVLVVVVAGLFAVGGTALYRAKPATYASEAGVLLQERPAALAETTPARDEVRYVANQVAIMKSNALLERASALTQKAEGIDGLSAGALARSMTIRTTEGSSYVVVRVEADDPETAKVAADSVVAAYRALVRADRAAKLNAAVRKLDAAIAAVARNLAKPNRTPAETETALALMQQLRAQRNRIHVDAQLAGDGVAMFSPAQAGTRDAAPLPATFLISLVLGALVGFGLAYLLDTLAARGINRHRPFGAPALTDIPEFAREGLRSKLPVLDAPASKSAQAFRLLGAIVDLPRASEQPAEAAHVESAVDYATVAFVASASGEGTTTVAANTAIAAAQAGKHVVLLDADLRGHGLTRLLGYLPRFIASDGNAGEQTVPDEPYRESIWRLFRSETGGSLSLVQAGSSISDAISAIRAGDAGSDGEQVDLVLIDVPPVLQFTWAEVLLKSADAVIVVAPHRRDVERTEQLLERLELLGVRPLGHVYNFVPSSESLRHGLFSNLLARWRAARRRPPVLSPAPPPRPARIVRAEPVAPEPAAPSPSPSHGEPNEEPEPYVQRSRRWA